MKIQYNETTGWASSRLSFLWDSETGVFSGDGVDRFVEYLKAVKAFGAVSGHPIPTSYKISDPFKNPGDLAAVLVAKGYPLPLELAPYAPQVSAEKEAGDLVLN